MEQHTPSLIHYSLQMEKPHHACTFQIEKCITKWEGKLSFALTIQ